MRVLGIDPGSRLTGWGVVEADGPAFHHLASGTIALDPSDPLGVRLARLHSECLCLLAAWAPAAVVLERAFVARNVQSAFRLGETRGAVLAAAGSTGTALHEYAPATVKLATVGYGQADKRAIGRGIALRLRLAQPPPPDAADALALALCHLQQAPLLTQVARVLAAHEPMHGEAREPGSRVRHGAERASASRPERGARRLV